MVFADLLGLSMSDILYIAAKNSSSGSPSGHLDRNVTIVPHLPLAHEHAAIRALATRPAWVKQHKWWYEMIQLASRRIDAHIDSVGQNEFARRLRLYRHMLDTARAECLGKAPKVCYWNDNGCFYPCLDRVAMQFEK